MRIFKTTLSVIFILCFYSLSFFFSLLFFSQKKRKSKKLSKKKLYRYHSSFELYNGFPPSFLYLFLFTITFFIFIDNSFYKMLLFNLALKNINRLSLPLSHDSNNYIDKYVHIIHILDKFIKLSFFFNIRYFYWRFL